RIFVWAQSQSVKDFVNFIIATQREEKTKKSRRQTARCDSQKIEKEGKQHPKQAHINKGRRTIGGLPGSLRKCEAGTAMDSVSQAQGGSGERSPGEPPRGR